MNPYIEGDNIVIENMNGLAILTAVLALYDEQGWFSKKTY